MALMQTCGSPTCARTILPAAPPDTQLGEAILAAYGWERQRQPPDTEARWYCPRCKD